MARVEANAIVRQFSLRGIACETVCPDAGGMWITSMLGVVTRASDQAPWHWSIIRSRVTQAGEGTLSTRKDMEAFLECLSALPMAGEAERRSTAAG